MLNNSRCIIVGGGSSIREERYDIPVTNIPIWNAIKSECLFTANWSFLYCEPTIALYSDYQFFVTQKELLDKLPMVVSIKDGYYDRKDSVKIGNNLTLLKGSSEYHGKDSWKLGFFSRHLTGIWSINFALRCGFEKIFVLGLDSCAINGHTHFYDDSQIGKHTWLGQERCGVGFNEQGGYKTIAYNTPTALNNFWFKPFENEKDKIINVSPKSAINTFSKWSYEQFYQYLKDNPVNINQDETRKDIRKLIHDRTIN
jgi:hypothetical protein